VTRLDLQARLVDLASSFVGITEEGRDNDGEMVRMFQATLGTVDREPWCLAFVMYCVMELDRRFKSQTILYPTESSQILWLKTPQVARVMFPEPGAIAIWTNYINGKPTSRGHVGIVKSIGPDGFMDTVEGNTKMPNTRAMDGVLFRRRHALPMATGDFRLTGFLLPFPG